MKKLIGGAIVAAFLVAASARAQFPGDAPNDIRFRFGGIFANLDSKVTFSTPDLPAGEIDVSRLLGDPDSKTAFRGEGAWNFAGRSFLDFGYVQFDTTNSASLSRDITFGGVTYTAGAEVSTESFSRFIYAAYRYGIVKNPGFQLGLSLGVCYTSLRHQISAAEGVVGPGGPIVGATTTREAELNAPVPLIGLEAEGRIARNLSVGAQVQAFSITVDPYSGNMFEALAHADWYFIPHVGVGGGYEWTKIDITKTQDTKTVGFVYRYDGPRIYVVVTF